MIVFVHKAHETLMSWQRPGVGRLLSPRQYSRAAESSLVFSVAADNDCFQGLDRDAFVAMLAALEDGFVPLRFIAIPDVVGDARATMRRFARWRDRVNQAGPPALCAQDGLTISTCPWDEISCLFIGGSTEWKCSDQAHVLVNAARERGKWVHMGRVNSARRMMLAKSWGCDSIDGTSVSMFTDIRLPERLAQAAAPQQLNIREAV